MRARTRKTPKPLAHPLQALGAAFCCAALALASCGREDPAPERPAATEARSYTVRGQIQRLPSPPRNIALIEHEEIPDLYNRAGEQVGMAAMTMDFPLGPGVSLDGYEVGDKVEMVMVVDWDPGYYIQEIRKLPPETELDLPSTREQPDR
jgi:Cu/Ag efflux protein CusF